MPSWGFKRNGETPHRYFACQMTLLFGPRLCKSSELRRTLRMPEERLVYGCVGADRPEAEPFIHEVDGILVHTCPECRKALDELDPGN